AAPGVIARFRLAPATIHDLGVVPEVAADCAGWLVGDRTSWASELRQDLQRGGIALLAPYRRASRDPWPRWSAQLSRLRYRIDTVFAQLVDRCGVKRVWARDGWHLWSRLLRQVLMHTLTVRLNTAAGNPPLRLSRLVA